MVPEDVEVSTVNFGGDVPGDDIREGDDYAISDMQYLVHYIEDFITFPYMIM